MKLREKGFVTKVYGIDANKANLATALSLGIVDEAIGLQESIADCQLIIVAIPVDATLKLLPQVMDLVTNQTVMDVGSTKFEICKAIDAHPLRSQFVATHPMWGTEYKGPGAARAQAFSDKAAVICDSELCEPDSLALVKALYQQLDMHVVYMNAKSHDVHAAYVSHVSHITSFALANTVLEKEKEDETIFELASAGFESTVRLAKSNPEMWVPIFRQNKENVLDVLNEHITQLRKFKACLEKENFEYLEALILQANRINDILK